MLGCVIRKRDQASIWLLVTSHNSIVTNISAVCQYCHYSIVSIVYNCLSRARLSFNFSRNPAAGLASFCGRLSVNLRDQTWESRQICFNCSSQGTINASSAFPASGNSEEIVIEDNQWSRNMWFWLLTAVNPNTAASHITLATSDYHSWLDSHFQSYASGLIKRKETFFRGYVSYSRLYVNIKLNICLEV